MITMGNWERVGNYINTCVCEEAVLRRDAHEVDASVLGAAELEQGETEGPDDG